MSRPVDEQATAAARKRQAAGEQLLQKIFRLPTDCVLLRSYRLAGVATLRGLTVEMPPPRRKTTCPRPRSDATKARHLARKRQHAARRTNW